MAGSAAVLGLGLLLISLFCLGTWPALLRLSSLHHHRNLCHAYVDYATAYFLISSILSILMLVHPRENNEPSDSMSFSSILVAMFGGSLLSAGNLSMQWATTVYHAPLTTVLSLQSSMTVLLGTSLNYALEPQKTPHPERLAVGVCVFWIAILMATKAQLMYSRGEDEGFVRGLVELETLYGSGSHDPEQVKGVGSGVDANGLHVRSTIPSSSHVSLDPGSDALSGQSESDSSEKTKRRGLLVAFLGGLCFGFFSPSFNIAVNDPFRTENITVASTSRVLEANLWFSFAFWFASLVGNCALLYVPGLSTSSLYKDHVQGDPGRRFAFAAGVVCAFGNVLQFQGGQLVGYATADLVQAYPIVSILWDVYLFGEFRQASQTLVLLLFGMYISYFLGIGLLASSTAD